MFNNLNNPNGQNGAKVDDIFAETDQATEGNAIDIETKKVGLVSDNNDFFAGNIQTNSMGVNTPSDDMASQMMSADRRLTPQPTKNYLRWVIIAVVCLALLGAAYFVYSQFFNIPETVNIEQPNNIESEVENVNQTPENPNNNSGFVEVVPEFINDEAIVNPDVNSDEAPVYSEVNLPEGDVEFVDPEFLVPGDSPEDSTNIINPDISQNDFQAMVDSDNDGLSDSEEIVLGTNINIIDTDNDGLSDYEEVKIYLTDPLNSDTDSDTFLDGAEVKSGYDPRVGGGAKLPGNNVLQ